jgi:hypothetical protein
MKIITLCYYMHTYTIHIQNLRCGNWERQLSAEQLMYAAVDAYVSNSTRSTIICYHSMAPIAIAHCCANVFLALVYA